MTPRPLKLAAATAVAGVIALGAAGIGAELRARAAVARLIAGLDGVTVAETAVDALAGRVTLKDVHARRGGLEVRIGSLAFASGRGALAMLSPDVLSSLLVTPARAFPTGDGASDATTPPASSPPPINSVGTAGAPGTASAENVVITYDNVTYTIPKIELAGTTLSSTDLAGMLDPASSEPIEARLRRVNAASVTVPEIRADTANGDFEQHWNQQQVLLANVVNGRAAIGSAGAGILKTRSSKSTTSAEIGGLQMTGIDMGQIVHVAATARTDDGEPLKPLADSFVVSAMKLTVDGSTPSFTLASLKEAGLKARPLALVSQARSVLLSVGKPGDPAVDAFLGDVVNSVSFTLLQADDLATAPPQAAEDGKEGGKQGLFRLGRIAITGFGDRRVGGMSVQNIVFEGPQGRLSLAGAEAKALTLPASPSATDPPLVDSFDMSGLLFDLNTAEAGQPDQRITFDVGRASIAVPGARIDSIPPKGAAAVEHFRIAIKPDMAPMLLTLGYPKLDISSRFASTYDAKAESLKIDDWQFVGTGMGTLGLKLDLGKVSNGLVSRDAETQKAAAAAVVVKSIDLRVHDDGLVDRLLAFKATQDGITVAQERDQIVDMIRTKLPVLAGDPPKLKPLEEAVARFVADPKQPLHVAISTPNGLGAADAGLLNDPTLLLDQLTVSASAGN